MAKIVTIRIQGLGVRWRRGQDSNLRWVCAHTRFPGVPVKPLRHLSAAASCLRSSRSVSVGGHAWNDEWRRGRDSNPRSRLPEIPVFETGAFNHSATSPGYRSRTRCINNCKSPLATTYFPTPRGAVSSALRRFTSVFGMGTGGSIALLSPRSFCDIFYAVQLSCRCVGSGGRIRTCDLRVMSPTSYHCSTPHRANQCATR